MANLRVCLAASEAVPFAKTGGLADVVGSLGKFFNRKGIDVRIFLPFYNTINTSELELHAVDFIQNVPVFFENQTLHFSAITTKLPGTGAEVYLIKCPVLFDRGVIYTGHDDPFRYAFFSRAVIECCQRMGWMPHIFHCNDWHTALVPLYIRTSYAWDRLFSASRTILTIHNIAYQGVCSSDMASYIGLSGFYDRFDPADLSKNTINFLKTGIYYSNMISTVSETYAREIQTPEYGSGLENILRMRSRDLVGIVNGGDYSVWNPATDKYIPYHYSPENLQPKEQNKRALLETLKLPYDQEAPVFGIVSRLTPQKGFEILMDALFPMLSRGNLRFLILGSGDKRYEDFFASAQKSFPHKVCFYKGYSDALAHLIEAGSDMFIMPSRFEPCGLNQIYSMKYGTVPIVRKTGGLADTVSLWNPHKNQGTGFIFEHFTANALLWAIDYATQTFRFKDAWRQLMLNGMSQNFSWEIQGQKYLNLYKRVMSY